MLPCTKGFLEVQKNHNSVFLDVYADYLHMYEIKSLIFGCMVFIAFEEV
jgi:hypothetical protein